MAVIKLVPDERLSNLAFVVKLTRILVVMIVLVSIVSEVLLINMKIIHVSDKNSGPTHQLCHRKVSAFNMKLLEFVELNLTIIFV